MYATKKKIRQKNHIAIVVATALTMVGCASNPNSSTASSETKSTTSSQGNSPSIKPESKVSNADNSKAAKKISMSIGEEVGDFNITSQQQVEAPAGYNGTQYTVKTKAGKTYKCEILEPSGFGKAMSWGMASGASAMCTDFTQGSKDKGKTNKASCNALLQAAGKC